MAETAKSYPGKLAPLPWIEVGESGLVSIEHPCILKNISKGIQMIGGDDSVLEAVHRNQNDQLRLVLNPADAMTRPIKSTKRDTANLALKLTVPKRTGRKRKRGSGEPWQNYDIECGPRTFSKDVLRTLRDNHGYYKTECVGVINHTHRWHDLSDFQVSTQDSELVQRLQDSFFGLDYRKIKGFDINAKEPGEWTKLIANPAMTHLNMPFNYGYMQNPAVQKTTDQSGNTTITNVQQPDKLLTTRITFDGEVPAAMNFKIVPIKHQDPELQAAVQTLQKLFDERPAWTRRGLMNKSGLRETVLKPIVQYVGYMFTSGPWRDAIIKYGVDPREDVAMHRYQTLMFQVTEGEKNPDQPWEDRRLTYARKSRGQGRDAESHIFDGENLVHDGKIWQVCDITDPLLKSVLETDNFRTTCDTRSDGWYHNGTWAKAKTIMKTKISALSVGQSIDDSDFKKVLSMPDVSYNANVKGTADHAVKKLRRQTDFGPKEEGRKRTKQPMSQSHILPGGSRWVKLGVEAPEETSSGVDGEKKEQQPETPDVAGEPDLRDDFEDGAESDE